MQLNRGQLLGQKVCVAQPFFAGVSQYEFAIVACTACGVMIPGRIDRMRLGIATLNDQRKIAADFEREFARWIADNPEGTVVISSEQLAYWLRSPAMKQALDAWLTRWFSTVEYVMFLRPMTDFLLSVHSEAILRGSPLSLDQFVAAEKEQPMVETALAWRNEFGSRVTVAEMGKSSRGREDLYAQFSDIAQIDITGLARPKTSNKSLNKVQRGFLRRVNALLGPRVTRGRVRGLVWRIARLLSAIFLFWGQKAQLSATQLAVIQSKHANPLSAAISNPPDAIGDGAAQLGTSSL